MAGKAGDALISSWPYNLQAAALAAGVEPNTLRAWENRYGVVEPKRSAGGHRRYSQKAVERLQKVAGLVRRGHAISEVAQLTDAELSKLEAARALESEGPADSGAVGARLVELLEAIRRFDLPAVAVAVKWLRAAAGARRFVLDVAVPLFQEIGELVSAGDLNIAQEHALSAVLRDQLGDILQSLQPLGVPRGDGGYVVFACPEDDLHEFGILLGAVLAASRGIGVLYAGPNLPAVSLAGLVSSCGVKEIVLGNTPIPPLERRVDFASYLEALDSAVAANVPLLVGGAGDRPLRTLPSGRPLRYLGSLRELDDIWAEMEHHGAERVAK